MSPRYVKEMLPIITAYAEGKTIQTKVYTSMPWQDSIDLSFSLSPCSYRIKPEKEKGWINLYKKNDLTITSGVVYKNKESAVVNANKLAYATIEIEFEEGQGK